MASKLARLINPFSRRPFNTLRMTDELHAMMSEIGMKILLGVQPASDVAAAAADAALAASSTGGARAPISAAAAAPEPDARAEWISDRSSIALQGSQSAKASIPGSNYWKGHRAENELKGYYGSILEGHLNGSSPGQEIGARPNAMKVSRRVHFANINWPRTHDYRRLRLVWWCLPQYWPVVCSRILPLRRGTLSSSPLLLISNAINTSPSQC